MKPVTLYITCESDQQAQQIATHLLKKRLVACVNILPAIQSLYWWNDEIQKDSEIALLAKTTQDKCAEIIERVSGIHSYDTPCVVAWPIVEGQADYLKWISEETSKKA